MFGRVLSKHLQYNQSPNRHLPSQSSQSKDQNKVWNVFKVKNKDRVTPTTYEHISQLALLFL